jgi:hypothetical protein
VRLATKEDLPAIEYALTRLQRKSKAPHLKGADFHKAADNMAVFISKGQVAIQGRYMVLYSVGIPWYGTTRTLMEMLVLRLPYPDDGDVTQVPDMLMQLAANNNCSSILVSDAQGMTYMRRVYETAGWSAVGIQLHKEC